VFDTGGLVCKSARQIYVRRGRPEGGLFKEPSIDSSPNRGERRRVSPSKYVSVVVSVCFLIASQSHALALMIPNGGEASHITVPQEIVVENLAIQKETLSGISSQEYLTLGIRVPVSSVFKRQFRPNLEYFGAVMGCQNLSYGCPLKQSPSVGWRLFQRFARFANNSGMPDNRRTGTVVCQPIGDAKRCNIVVFQRFYNPQIRRSQVRFASSDKRLLRDVGLTPDSGPLKSGDEHINDGDIYDCPASRRWPPPSLAGFVLATFGFAIFLYGAKRFTNLGLRARVYHLWWVPLIYLLICFGLRLSAISCW
jgi:hypothetical protein